jgi:hypothetical protein
MRCILGYQGCELLQEIHVDTCGHHAGPRTLVGKAFRQGFYWPTAVTDSKDFRGAVKGANSTLGKLTSRCKRCRQSPSRGPLQFGTSTWWGLSGARGLHPPPRSS